MSGNAQSEMSPGEVREMCARVSCALPLDMPKKVADGWIHSPALLAKVLRRALMPPEDDGGASIFLSPGMQFWFFVGYNAWLEVSHPEHAISREEMEKMGDELLGMPAEAMLFYCHCNGDSADVVLTSQLAWEYICACRRTWKYDGVVFNLTRMKLASREPARPAGFYHLRLPEQDRKAGAVGKQFQGKSVNSVRQGLGQNWGMGPEGLQILGITHPHYPELMNGSSVPFIDLPGLAVDPDGDGDFSYAPGLDFDEGELGLDCSRVEGAGSDYGSGFLQQYA